MESSAKQTIRTKPEEFVKFHNLLMSNAPEGYTPWYFPVVKGNKAPDALAIISRAYEGTPQKERCSWKSPHARLSSTESFERLKLGENVGIAARQEDPLIIIDIDNWIFSRLMPDTLVNKSRKRCGFHGFCWKKTDDSILPINIPTEEYGEVRSSDQYVVAAGSFCETSETDIDKENIPESLKEEIKKDDLLGVYTVEKEKSPAFISFDDLPYFFKEQFQKTKEQKPIEMKNVAIKPTGKHSALFDLKITDIVAISPGKREPHPLHSSDTGQNFSISGDLAHCWRHNVSLNALQFLVVKSGYMDCSEAGSGHKGSGAGISRVAGNNGAIFNAWIQAKKDGLIPKDDPIPIRAMKYIAEVNKLITKVSKRLPAKIYNRVLEIVEKEY